MLYVFVIILLVLAAIVLMIMRTTPVVFGGFHRKDLPEVTYSDAELAQLHADLKKMHVAVIEELHELMICKDHKQCIILNDNIKDTAILIELLTNTIANFAADKAAFEEKKTVASRAN